MLEDEREELARRVEEAVPAGEAEAVLHYFYAQCNVRGRAPLPQHTHARARAREEHTMTVPLS